MPAIHMYSMIAYSYHVVLIYRFNQNSNNDKNDDNDDVNDFTHYRESFLEVMNEIED